jgi:(R,R)-butanediol dehydrogenase/meso-butanediol dehydrogenase/diacetyl reductase
MRAVTFEGTDKKLGLVDIPIPEAGPGQLLLKVAACGICGSDLHAYQAQFSPPGTVFGHEFAGEIVAVGDQVDGDWQVGDRAIALGALSCGQCVPCQAGNLAACINPVIIGYNTNGAYAEYVLVQAAMTIKIADGTDYPSAALVEPLTVGLAAIRACELPMAGNILIIGAGIIGITVIKWAKFFGAEHVGISDLEPARLKRAGNAGATVTINASECEDPVEAFRQATGTDPQVIVECVGAPMLQNLVEIAPRKAHIVAVGCNLAPEPITSFAAAQKQLRMTFCFGYTLEDFQFVVRIIEAGRIETGDLITRTVSLEEVPDAFADLMQPNEHCKVMIQP